MPGTPGWPTWVFEVSFEQQVPLLISSSYKNKPDMKTRAKKAAADLRAKVLACKGAVGTIAASRTVSHAFWGTRGALFPNGLRAEYTDVTIDRPRPAPKVKAAGPAKR
jgi:hypothetical protein